MRVAVAAAVPVAVGVGPLGALASVAAAPRWDDAVRLRLLAAEMCRARRRAATPVFAAERATPCGSRRWCGRTLAETADWCASSSPAVMPPLLPRPHPCAPPRGVLGGVAGRPRRAMSSTIVQRTRADAAAWSGAHPLTVPATSAASGAVRGTPATAAAAEMVSTAAVTHAARPAAAASHSGVAASMASQAAGVCAPGAKMVDGERVVVGGGEAAAADEREGAATAAPAPAL